MTTKAPDQSTPAVPAKKITPKPAFSAVLSVLGLFVLNIVLPVIVAGGAVWTLFYYLNMWQYGMSLALFLFGAAVVAIALILTIVADPLLMIVHKNYRKQGVRFGTGPLARLVRLVLGGLIIPIAVVLAANFVIVPGLAAKTTMNWLVAASQRPVTSEPPEEIAALALQSHDPSTKILSIQVLQTFHSPLALTQLVRIANEDRTALSDSGVYNQLVKAIASYGSDARDPLKDLFKNINTAEKVVSSGVGSSLYERYFAGSFDSLSEEIKNGSGDQASKDARLAQIQAAQTQLKNSLTGVEETSSNTPDASDPRLDFVMKTFLATDIKSDGDLLAFAKTTAADPNYSRVVRGDALLLIAKLGDKNEVDSLLGYINNSDSYIQSHALQAIAVLQAKLNNDNSQSGN
jgi:hypothetical protein